MTQKQKCSENKPIFTEVANFEGVVYSDEHSYTEDEVVLAEVQKLVCEDCETESFAWKRVCNHDVLSDTSTLDPILALLSSPLEERGNGRCRVCKEVVSSCFNK